MVKCKNKINQKSTLNCLHPILLQFIILLLLGPIRAQEENHSSLPNFEAIHVSGVAKVFYTQEERKAISMTISGDPFPQVIREVKNGILEISTRGEARNEIVEVYVSHPVLNSITVSDRAEFHITQAIQNKDLRIEVNDVGSANITVNVDALAIHMNGGDLTISGVTNKQYITKSEKSQRGTLDTSRLKTLH